MGILEGKTILVAGVTLDTSIGFHVAKIAQAEGATVVVSNFGRAMSLTGRVIKKLDPVPLLLEVDVTNEDHLAGLAAQLGEHLDHLDGLVHSLAFANPETALGGSSSARRGPTSAPRCRCRPIAGVVDHGLQALAGRAGLGRQADFDATVSWPVYDWMGCPSRRWRAPAATCAIWDRRGYVSIWWPPVRWKHWRRRPSAAPMRSMRLGVSGRRWAGIEDITPTAKGGCGAAR